MKNDDHMKFGNQKGRYARNIQVQLCVTHGRVYDKLNKENMRYYRSILGRSLPFCIQSTPLSSSKSDWEWLHVSCSVDCLWFTEWNSLSWTRWHGRTHIRTHLQMLMEPRQSHNFVGNSCFLPRLLPSRLLPPSALLSFPNLRLYHLSIMNRQFPLLS